MKGKEEGVGDSQDLLDRRRRFALRTRVKRARWVVRFSDNVEIFRR